MAKRRALHKHKTTHHAKHKPIVYYIKIYAIAVFVGALVFLTGTYFVKPAIPCANSKSCTSDLSQHVDNNAIGYFMGKKVTPPKIDLAQMEPPVLGDETNSNKHIYVDLTSQTLYAYDGNNLFMKTPISSGKWGKTPIGNFKIWEKLISTTMAGGEGADAYDLPNVPYTMYFYHDFGLHGAYWHDNFGHTMSHGCVNMRQIDAKQLFGWAEVGTPVSTCDSFTTPSTCVQSNPIN